ncbi:MAG TPA: RNase adapter RapZ [Candidatus Baltobacteraceae bacterium]|nr:RNase adapter RapZ [Candidatus Baltobacteraceae bacterium]
MRAFAFSGEKSFMTVQRSARLVFVTGLSGAGKSQAMKTLEDLGFYCIDNLPPKLAAQTLELLDQGQVREVAVALDVRSGGTLGEALPVLNGFSHDSVRPLVLFLDARDDVLVRRYSETRRRHPFASAGSLREAIAIERTTLAPLRSLATHVIDTTTLTQAALKERIVNTFEASHEGRHLTVTVVAFGFKYGIPLDLDMLFDVRFLHNPNYIDELRPLTGADPSVAQYIETDPATQPFLDRLFDMMDFLMPRFLTEGKSQVTIGVGCTGGRHRSVYVARRLALYLENLSSIELYLEMRDATR